MIIHEKNKRLRNCKFCGRSFLTTRQYAKICLSCLKKKHSKNYLLNSMTLKLFNYDINKKQHLIILKGGMNK